MNNNLSVVDISTTGKALSDPTRVRLLHILHTAAFRVGELEKIQKMGQSRVSRHLKILLDGEILSFRREGTHTFYSYDPAEQLRGILDAIVQSGTPDEDDAAAVSAILTERRSETRKFFDTRAHSWEQAREDLFSGVDIDAIVASFVPPSRVVADLGCGTGHLSARLLERSDKLIGIDNSRAMLDQARKRFAGIDSSDFRLGEIEHLPIADGEVDIAVFSLVLHHLPRPEDALREARRILKPAGRVVIADFLPHANDVFRTSHGDQWLGFAPENLHRWLSDTGFVHPNQQTYELNNSLNLICLSAEKRPDG